MLDFKYFKRIKTEAGAAKRYRELAKQYHPDTATTAEEQESLNRTMQEINAEHQDLLVLIRHGFFKQQADTDAEMDTVQIKRGLLNGLAKVAQAFQFTDEQKQEITQKGREMLNFAYDSLVQNTLNKNERN